MRFRINNLSLILSVVAGLSVTAMLNAQTWYGPADSSPTNIRCDSPDCSTTFEIKNISQLGGDNLGSHEAEFNLNLFSNSTYHSITGVESNDANQAIFLDALGTGTGLYVESQGGRALEARNNSLQATVRAINADTGYGLETDSSGTYSALLTGDLQIQGGQLTLGTDNTDTFYLNSGNPTATSDLYWGQSLLCDASETNCGYITSGGGGDNLGNVDGVTRNPHLASMNLDLEDFSIYRLGSSSGDSALQVSHTGTTNVAQGGYIRNIVNTSVSGSGSAAVYGLTSSSNSSHSGVVALQSGSGTGLIAESSTGKAALLYGRANLNSASDQVLFNNGSSDLGKLGIISDSTPTADLYWGDKLLCDSSQTNCGWGGTSTEHWKQNTSYARNIYYNQGFVGIQNNLPDYQLEVGTVSGTIKAPLGTIGSIYTSTVGASGSIYVGRDMYVSDSVTVNTNGVYSVGDIVIGNGNTLGINTGTGFTYLTENDLNPSLPTSMVAKCIAAGYCTAP